METQLKTQSPSTDLIEQVKPEELDHIIDGNEYTIIDVRNPSAIASQGGIPSAVNIPLEELKTAIDHRLENPDHLLNGSGPFLFCCTGGVMSYMGAIHAKTNGIKNVFNLEGGHAAWVKLKDSQRD